MYNQGLYFAPGITYKKITMMSPPPQERAALVSKALYEDIDSVQRAVGAISADGGAAAAEATMEDDKTMIFAAIVKLLPRGFLGLENMMVT